MISFSQVHKRYPGGYQALKNVSFEIAEGEMVFLTGHSGAGKSTLLKLMAGLLQPWSGRIEILGAPPGREARRVAYVPQAELVDWAFPVTVEDVVMMGRFPRLGPVRRPGQGDRRSVHDALEQVGMGDHLRTQIGRLSGGQRRRVFLARALAAEPDLFLLDEPVTGIDPTTQELLMDILEAQAERGKTVVATTHDLACAAQRFQQVLAVNQTWTYPVEVTMNEPGVNQRLIFELWIYNQTTSQFQYHERWGQIWLNVTAPAT